MFNAPRPGQKYGGPSTNSFGGSFVDQNPLASSVYDDVDPWSAAPSPSATPAPPASSVFSAVIGQSTHLSSLLNTNSVDSGRYRALSLQQSFCPCRHHRRRGNLRQFLVSRS